MPRSSQGSLVSGSGSYSALSSQLEPTPLYSHEAGISMRFTQQLESGRDKQGPNGAVLSDTHSDSLLLRDPQQAYLLDPLPSSQVSPAGSHMSPAPRS